MSADILENSDAVPFFFDVNFAAPEANKPVPTIELPAHEVALREAEEKGHERGLAEGKTGEEARLADEAKRIAEAAEKILAAIDQDRVHLEKESAFLALNIARRLAGEALLQFPHAEIEKLISDCLGPLRNTPHLVVRLNEKDASAINETVGKFAREAGFEGRFIVLGEPDFAEGDCRIEWADGGIVRDWNKSKNEIETAIKSYFKNLGLPEEDYESDDVPTELDTEGSMDLESDQEAEGSTTHE